MTTIKRLRYDFNLSCWYHWRRNLTDRPSVWKVIITRYINPIYSGDIDITSSNGVFTIRNWSYHVCYMNFTTSMSPLFHYHKIYTLCVLVWSCSANVHCFRLKLTDIFKLLPTLWLLVTRDHLYKAKWNWTTKSCIWFLYCNHHFIVAMVFF